MLEIHTPLTSAWGSAREESVQQGTASILTPYPYKTDELE